MARKGYPANAEHDPPRRGPRARGRWWATALALLLLLGGAAATAGLGKPFALSVLDGLVFVAFAVVVGIYVILNRVNQAEESAEGDERDSAGEKH